MLLVQLCVLQHVLLPFQRLFFSLHSLNDDSSHRLDAFDELWVDVLPLDMFEWESRNGLRDEERTGQQTGARQRQGEKRLLTSEPTRLMFCVSVSRSASTSLHRSSMPSLQSCFLRSEKR